MSSARNRRGLVAVAVFALVSVVVPAGFALVGFAAILAAQLLIYVAIPALLICTVVVLRWLRDPVGASRDPREQRAHRALARAHRRAAREPLCSRG